ncbi:unnamed protein product [Lactuca saligna]|uniref:RING-type domain-containing protein n=1 Tax=Lactuca saligna TaxID=75948 RepID=A0AA35Y0H6_LACSI|nr:unnamed protein product [Lactuca saligna]
MHHKEGCHWNCSSSHHAAKKGLEQIVKLLLLHGASALLMNNGQTALDVARLNGYSNVVRAIENHICLFSGWLRALYIVPGFAQPPPRKVRPHSFNIQASSIRSPTQITKITNPITQNKEKSQWQNNDAGTSRNSVNYPPPTVSSAPPISDIMDDDLVHYISTDSTLIEKEKENKDSSTCVICLDAPIEGVCIPCGHMAGCMSCLDEVKGKNCGYPVCRTKIDQVVRGYAVKV